MTVGDVAVTPETESSRIEVDRDPLNSSKVRVRVIREKTDEQAAVFSLPLWSAAQLAGHLAQEVSDACLVAAKARDGKADGS